MAITLRPYQTAIIDQVRSLLAAGARSILVQAPTGAGKTALTAEMLGTASSRGHRCWFVVHRRELVRQSIRAFALAEIPHAVIASGFPADPRPLVQIAGVQTLAQRYDRLRPPRMIVWDEAHHVAAAGWAKIHKAFPDSIHIGLTATPERLDGRGLDDWFECMVMGPSVEVLIRDGYLSPYRLFAPPSGGPDLSGLKSRAGDYARDELVATMDRPSITGDAVDHYLRHAAGRRAVVFCASIEHSQHVVARFQASGVVAEHVDGCTDSTERDGAIERFTTGQTTVISNVDLFGEGFDLPAIEVAILLRPTQSLGLYLQQVGRSLRTSAGKVEAVILDHAGNAARHGLPDDEREWTLQGRTKRRKSKDADATPVRTCPRCFAANPMGGESCRFCGFVWEIQPRGLDEVAGELVEIDPAVARRQRLREQGSANSLDDLVALATSRGYKKPHAWAKHVYAARMKRIAG